MLLLFTDTLHRKWSRTIGDRILQRVKYWEIFADNLSKAGWSWGCVSTVDYAHLARGDLCETPGVAPRTHA
jgi:hypothetical protein